MHSSSDSLASSASAASLSSLTADQQVRLTEVLDDYLQQLENHQPAARSAILSKHPEMADVLEVYLDKLDQLHGMTTPTGCGQLAGQTLGDYELVAEIGRGGMGVVFSANDKKLDRLVAVKLLPMADLLDEKHVERFRNEARAAANLQHPHIVPVFSIGQQGGIHYFAMRLIDGPSLAQRIGQHEDDQTLPPTDRVLKQFAEVAEALHAAHEHGVVHRDIKPSNLLLDSKHSLWIADFGLARFQTATPLTQTGDMIGTMRYMSPEQATGRGELVDHRTDIYSLGATLFELLTLRPVIEGEDGPGLLRTIATQPTPKLRRYRPDCPLDLQTVLEKAMARERDDRYASALELAADLRSVAQRRPISARPISAFVHASRWANRNTLSLLIACSLLIVALSGAFLLLLDKSKDQTQKDLNLATTRGNMLALTKVVDDLASVPGSEQIRRKVLERSLNYFQDFARQSSGSLLLRGDTASVHSRMGAIYEELGDPVVAIQHYERAEEIYDQLVTESPNSSHIVKQRNENLNHLGLALSDCGNLPEALATLRQAVAEQRAAGTKIPPETLALTLSNYGVALHKASRGSDAQKAYVEAIDLLDTAHTQRPDDDAVSRGLAAAHQNYGVLRAAYSKSDRRGSVADTSVAQQHLNQALKLQIALAAQPGNKVRISRDLVSTYLHLGDLQLAERSLDAAQYNFGAAAAIAQQLVTLSPVAPYYLRDLAISTSNLGMTYYQQGNERAAMQSLKEAEGHYRKLVSLYPEMHQVKLSLGVSLNNQGIALQGSGDTEAAEDTFLDAASFLQAAHSHLSSQTSKDALDRVYANHARLLYLTGRDDEADTIIEKRASLVGSAPSGSKPGNSSAGHQLEAVD